MKNFEKILDDKKIKKILKRISYQILEGNLDESEIFLVGINKNRVRENLRYKHSNLPTCYRQKRPQ